MGLQRDSELTRERSPWPRYNKTRLMDPLRAGILKGGRCPSIPEREKATSKN
jgi:hypothetical protein